MANRETHEGGIDPFEGATLTPDRIAIAAGVAVVPVFAYVPYILFEEPVFGIVVGAIIGLGTALSLPLFLYAEAVDDLEEWATRTDRSTRIHRPAAGFVLAPAGVMLIAWRFVSSDVLTGAAVLLVVGAVGYAALVRLLPRV